jgi:sugar (glycoside-pentoside-hexuronide) transporter
MTDTPGEDRLSLTTKIGFGVAEFSGSLTWTMIAIIFLFFLTDVVGMDPAVAGFVLMIGTLWDAVTDPTVGVISDRLNNRWGRRRPILLATAIPYGLATWLLFTDPGLGETGTQIYFIFAIMFYYPTSTMLEVPYTSLAAEMTRDYDERARLLGFRAFFSQVGSIVAGASPWLMIAWFSERLGSVQSGWSATAAIFGFITIFPILWTWRATRGHEQSAEPVPVDWSHLITGPLQNRTFRYTFAGYAVANIALGASGSVAIYFMTYYLHFDDTDRSMAYLFLFSCTILWIPVISAVTTRYGKKTSYILFVGTWALVQSIGIMMIQPTQTEFYYVLMLIASGGIVSVSLTGFAMVPDTIEVDEFKYGVRREGLYIGINMFTQKFCTAMALWLVGIILSWIGYVPDQEQTEYAMSGIKVLYALGTALCLLVSIVMIYFMPMTSERHEALKQAINNKQQGIVPDTSKIEMLL